MGAGEGRWRSGEEDKRKGGEMTSGQGEKGKRGRLIDEGRADKEARDEGRADKSDNKRAGEGQSIRGREDEGIRDKGTRLDKEARDEEMRNKRKG